MNSKKKNKIGFSRIDAQEKRISLVRNKNNKYKKYL